MCQRWAKSLMLESVRNLSAICADYIWTRDWSIRLETFIIWTRDWSIGLETFILLLLS